MNKGGFIRGRGRYHYNAPAYGGRFTHHFALAMGPTRGPPPTLAEICKLPPVLGEGEGVPLIEYW